MLSTLLEEQARKFGVFTRRWECAGQILSLFVRPSFLATACNLKWYLTQARRNGRQVKPSQGAAPSAALALDIAVNQKLMLEELRETLEQIAALCPQHSLFDRKELDSHEGTASTPCRVEDFELATDASGEILRFSCRHSTTGICAGYVSLHRKEKKDDAPRAG